MGAGVAGSSTGTMMVTMGGRSALYDPVLVSICVSVQSEFAIQIYHKESVRSVYWQRSYSGNDPLLPSCSRHARKAG